jgi:hypothetical protein
LRCGASSIIEVVITLVGSGTDAALVTATFTSRPVGGRKSVAAESESSE